MILMPKKTDTKKLYHGTFNWYGQNIEVWKYAYSETHFMFLASVKLANLIGTTPRAVRQFFDGSKDNYKVEQVKKQLQPD